MKNVSCLAVAAAFALAGCMTDRTKSLFNPPSIHSSDDAASAAGAAGAIPVDQYYAALKGAQGKAKNSTEINDYVDKGIGLVSAYCLRWFQRLDETQRRLAMQQKDFNIIRDLGTALLGIGGANSTIVSVYGGLNTAYSGMVENFNESVLAGPTTAKIKSQMLEMLNQSETKLRSDAAGLSFTQAYNRIELHADTCTYSTVRTLLDSSLSATKPDRNPETGKITSQRIESTYQFDDSSEKLQAFWRPQGSTDNAADIALKQWMAKNRVDNVSITYFINTPEYAPFRAKAVKDLKL